MENSKIRQIRAKKKKLNQELERQEALLADAFDERRVLENYEPPAIPGMDQHQTTVSLACLVSARDVRIRALREEIDRIRLRMAKLTVEESRFLGRV